MAESMNPEQILAVLKRGSLMNSLVLLRIINSNVRKSPINYNVMTKNRSLRRMLLHWLMLRKDSFSLG